MIVWVGVVLGRTVCGDVDRPFHNLSGSHYQSQHICSGFETFDNVITNNPSQDYTHPDDHTSPTYDMNPGYEPFTVLNIT